MSATEKPETMEKLYKSGEIKTVPNTNITYLKIVEKVKSINNK